MNIDVSYSCLFALNLEGFAQERFQFRKSLACNLCHAGCRGCQFSLQLEALLNSLPLWDICLCAAVLNSEDVREQCGHSHKKNAVNWCAVDPASTGPCSHSHTPVGMGSIHPSDCTIYVLPEPCTFQYVLFQSFDLGTHRYHFCSLWPIPWLVHWVNLVHDFGLSCHNSLSGQEKVVGG